ncbi:MAG: 3D domain-containing protein [Deltaproteobacteria bacterium]|jgi:3D (Asp-Asp-Asp) domain-containing protein|nr:3D domain-containing protein [Deltaproteobacteria bacterium]
MTRSISIWSVVLFCLFAVTASADEIERTLVVTATAYNSLPGQTDDQPHVAAWGDPIKPGMKVIAVSPDLISEGLDRRTPVKIAGFPGVYLVLDKMHERWKKRIDIYMGHDLEAARSWGKRKVEISW